ncbi:MAG TPA: hypothetical protein VMT62_05360, partial [Syntrophorhabdaceae bacterium]|nr:hypothetical protein [Syntrophorhabdaceae bacterium]
MRIKTTLTIAGFLPLALFLVIGSMYVYSSRQVSRAAKAAEMASNVRQKVIDLSLVTHYYLLR